MKRFFIWNRIIVSTLMIAVGLTACQHAATTQQRDKDEEHGSVIVQYSCLENPMDGGAWRAIVRGVTKSLTRLSD